MKPPNLLIIFADQLRRDALGIYGDKNAITPHIDQLAGQGVRFRQACSTYPICVPFRFTMMTGEYAHSRFVPGIEWRMSPAERTLADEFNAADYETFYIGKWHLYGGHAVLPGHTTQKANLTPVPRLHQGRWQHWRGFELANNPFHTCYFVDDDPTPRPLGKYQTDGLTDLAIDCLKSRTPADKPFCCILSVEPPHFPLQAPPELEEKWLNREITLPPNYLVPDKRPTPMRKISEQNRAESIRQRKIYHAMVENLDQNVGRIREFLRTSGLEENTIVVLFSDHGEMGGAHAEGNLHKEHPYEESIGIPLIVYDPRLPERAGSSIAEPTCTEDLFPTLLGLCGLQPSTEKPGMDLTPLVRGQAEKLPREGVMLEYVHHLASYSYHAAYWRGFHSRRFKYTVLGGAEGGEPWQFFDLENDPYELENLLDHPAWQGEIENHHRLLRERLVETVDHFVLKPAYGQPGLNLWKPSDASTAAPH